MQRHENRCMETNTPLRTQQDTNRHMKTNTPLRTQQDKNRCMEINTQLRTEQDENRRIGTEKERASKGNNIFSSTFIGCIFSIFVIFLVTEETCACEKHLKPVHRKLDIILAIIQDNNPCAEVDTTAFNLLPDFPLNNLEAFKKFCNELQTSIEVRKQFVS